MTRRWLRIELARRWRSLVVLTLLIAVATGVILTSLAAARRGASAITRLQARTLPATVDVLANTPGFDWSRVRSLPEVAAMSTFVVDYTIAVEGAGGNVLDFPPADANWLNTIERPVILAGRNLNPARADEVLVSPKFLTSYHKHVGDTVVIELPSEQQLASSETGDSPATLSGPRITARIVGVAVSPWFPNVGPGVQLSPGLVAHYPLQTVGAPGPMNTQFVNAIVRLRHGAADETLFRNDLERLTGRRDITVGDLVEEGREIQRHIAFESRCLIAFALAAFVAAVFLIGQAITRYASATANELQTLQSLGMTPRQAVRAAAAAPALVGVAGALLGAVGAYVASAWFPFGGAAFYEPSPGRQFDVLLTTIIVPVVIALVAGGAATAAALALANRRPVLARRRSTIATGLARVGAPVPIVIGTRFALESGRGRTAVPVRPALVGAVVGVLGVLAAFTFSQGVSDAASHPERFGQTFQLAAYVGLNGQDFGPNAKVDQVLRDDADVAGFADARTAVATGPYGDDSVSVWEFQPGAKQLPIVLLSGRLPEHADEIVLGPKTLSAFHAHIGDHVVLRGSRPGAGERYLVTGSGLLPEGPHNSYFDGAWVTSAGYNTIFTGFKFHLDLVTLRSGLSASAGAASVTATLAHAVPAASGIGFAPPDPPAELGIIREVERLPVILGGFLALLAIGAVGHALATAVRRRAHDLAVLRALGMTRWQCRWIVVTQASVLALVGLAFGVPLGLAAGRSVWRWVADFTPIAYVPPLAVWALALVGPAAVLVANLLAAWPGQRAARLRVSHVLRAE